MKSFLVCAALLTASVLSTAADAKGCIKGAIVGGVAGHYAGRHGKLGAVAGCIVGHHEASKDAKANQQAPTPDSQNGRI